ncbi:MAG: hypothetical protein KDD45_11750 [Bdellovibrionales bacterium]|nr:hypothetical protein [Bdellovibrionales bacterium]
MINENHPIYLVLSLIDNGTIESKSKLSFSKHKYSFKDNIDEREVMVIISEELSLDWLENKIKELNEGWEFSMHSNIVLRNGEIMHLPMIDFNFEVMSKELEGVIEYRMGKKDILLSYKDILYDMSIYSSGRSYHGYGKSIITNEQWIEFTTAIILLNYTYNIDDYSIIVDNRWIAHRLLAKYSCLRWSNQTSQFKKYPELEKSTFINAPNNKAPKRGGA